MKKIVPVFLSFILLAASIIYVADKKSTDNSDKEISTASAVNQNISDNMDEMRGVWVTYMTLDVENEADKENAFKEKTDSIIEDMLSSKLNTMTVQVRPFSDALYPSKYYPWSHIISGTQGVSPGFDPLDYIISTAHKNGIAVQAWINPYRISTKNTPTKLSEDNPYNTDPSMCTEVNGSLYLKPSSKKAQELIVNGVREIAETYDIDGVQFDDYFYPPDCGNFDEADYESYKAESSSDISLEEFRKQNVNELVKAVYEAVHKARENIVFGISPQGNIGNNEGLYADVKLWCEEEGYIDYICPQIYFSLDNPALTFEDALKSWTALDVHDGLQLYVGLPAYKGGTDADSGTWLDNSDILKTELEISRDKTDGFMLYSYDSFRNEENAEEIENVIKYLNYSVDETTSEQQ